MEITRMNQTCPHYQALVILPELVRNYGDMLIQYHDCESSFFLPPDQLSNQCAFALCLLKLHITLANPPLAAFTRLARHSSGRLHRASHRRGRVSIRTRLFGYVESGLDDDTDNIDRFF